MKKFTISVTTLIIVTLLFGLGGLSFVAYFKTRELLISNLEMHISSLTRSSGSEVGLWLKAHQTDMEVMANTPLLESMDQNLIIPYMRKESLRNKDFEQFFTADSKGNSFSNSSYIFSVADCDYFQKVMASGESVISDPVVSKESGNRVIVLASPIKNGDKIVGLIGGTVNIAELTRIVSTKRVAEIGYAFMVQEDGQIMTQSNQEFTMSNNALKEDNASLDFKGAIRKMIQVQTGVTRSSFQNKDTYLAFAPVPGVKWSFGLVVPVSYVTNQLRYLPINFGLLTIFVGFLLVFVLNRWLVIPLAKLAKFTTELGGNLQENVEDNYRLNGPVAEVQSLATNFQTMASALHSSFQELDSLNGNLEREVSERTTVQQDLKKSYEELGAAEEELRCNYDKLQAQGIALRESERRFRSLLENVELITGIISMEGRVIFINDFALRLTGFEQDEVIGQDYFSSFIPVEVRDNVKFRFTEALNSNEAMYHGTYPILIKSGEKRLVHWNNTLLFDSEGKVTGFASIGEDITERRKFEKRLKYLSFHDSLTSLYNRTYFEENLKSLEGESFAPLGMIICDVDGLKLVNDTLGHSTGDRLLRLTAGIIKQCFREGDLLFRIGGDEFAIILPNSGLSLVEQACYRIRQGVENYNVAHDEFPLSLSVGFAVSRETYPNIGDVFKEADTNMYREKLNRCKSSRSALVQVLNEN